MRPRQPPNLCASPRNGPQGRKSHPDHAPPYSVRGEKSTPGSYATTLTSLSSLAGAHANAAGSPAPAISGTTEHNASASMSSVHHPFAAFPPFAQFGRDSGSSYLNMSSAFSSLIVSTLMQNPAVHAAATVAASFWPTADAEASTGSASESFVGGIPMRQMNPSPSMAAIAAATVAAASAWWATHGLLPFCPPPAAFHGGFAFAPAPTSAIPRTKTAYAAKDDTQRKEEATHSQPWTCPRPVDLRAPAPGQQPSPLSSSDSDESGEAGSSRTTALKAPTVVVNHLNPAPDSREVRESDIGRGQKKADRSSCGSNTPSSSDVETDVVLNLDKAMEEPKETHLGHLPSGGDASNRRLRGGGSVGESWKEVSQEVSTSRSISELHTTQHYDDSTASLIHHWLSVPGSARLPSTVLKGSAPAELFAAASQGRGSGQARGRRRRVDHGSQQQSLRGSRRRARPRTRSELPRPEGWQRPGGGSSHRRNRTRQAEVA